MKTLLSLLGDFYTYLAARFFFRSRRDAEFILLLGGPGAGKGTVSGLLAPRLGLPHLNMGQIFRREIAANTAIGRKWGPVIKAGKLVPDHVVMKLLRRELKKPEYHRGAILDGIPRTAGQARQLARVLGFWGNRIKVAVCLEVPLPDLIERLSLRRSCSNKDCGKTYHVKFKPPKKDGVCDDCGSPLTQRADDAEEVIKERMREFERTFADLRAYLESLGVFAVVSATNALNEIQVCEKVVYAIAEAD